MVAVWSGATNCPCCRRPCSTSRSYVDASEYVPAESKLAESNRQSTDPAVRKAQKLRDYRRKETLQLRITKNKKAAPKQFSDMNNSANTIAALLPRSSTSGAGPSSAGNAPAIAARERRLRIQEHRQRQERQSNLAWQTESLEYRLRAAQESYDVQMVRTLELDRARSASLEATRRFFQFPGCVRYQIVLHQKVVQTKIASGICLHALRQRAEVVSFPKYRLNMLPTLNH